MERKLRRIKEKAWLGGVCAGLAYFGGLPLWLVRLAWILTVIFYGSGILPYLLFWIFMPRWENTPDDYDSITAA